MQSAMKHHTLKAFLFFWKVRRTVRNTSAKCSTGTESAEDVKFLTAVTAVKPVHVPQRAFSCFSFRCVQDGY